VPKLNDPAAGECMPAGKVLGQCDVGCAIRQLPVGRDGSWQTSCTHGHTCSVLSKVYHCQCSPTDSHPFPASCHLYLISSGSLPIHAIVPLSQTCLATHSLHACFNCALGAATFLPPPPLTRLTPGHLPLADGAASAAAALRLQSSQPALTCAQRQRSQDLEPCGDVEVPHTTSPCSPDTEPCALNQRQADIQQGCTCWRVCTCRSHGAMHWD
jgi:hypothetical protein